ncbi:MAG: hypothetical protein V7722_09270 [Porticoccus sp.]
MITEDQLKQLCFEWFQSIGYGIAPSVRSDYHQIILHDCFFSRLKVINPQLPEATLEIKGMPPFICGKLKGISK